MHSPQDSNTEQFGVAVGSLMAPCLLCEDSIFFKQPMLYSLQAKSKVLVWRCPQSLVLQIWSLEMQREMQLLSLEKYRWLFERI